MLSINAAHDPDSLARDYAAKGRLQIRDFLVEADAESVLQSMTNATPWGVAFNDGPRVIQLDMQATARMTAAQGQELLAGIQQRARTGYQFVYNYYPLYESYFDPNAARTPLFAAFEFVNSPAFLDFTRRLTGLEDIRWADAHATLYQAGHFLKYHTDETPSQRRLAAYVLNFTKGWGRDWGGYLQFFNDRYDIEEAYRPIFNGLNIFTIPADHSVGMVSSYCANGRYSITGWLRGDEPPGPIGG